MILLRLDFSSPTAFGKKLLWYADVLAYIVVVVVGMFVGLEFIKSTYTLINKLWFSPFAKSLSRRECLIFPRLAARASKFNISEADVMPSRPLSAEINLTP